MKASRRRRSSPVERSFATGTEIGDLLSRNLKRVDSLIEIFDKRAPQGSKFTEDTDILRAAVVLLHAALEEFLRNIAIWKLPSTLGQQSNIPLVGKRRGEKFVLGDLTPHRDLKVKELIRLSVKEHFDASSFSEVSHVEGLLRDVNISSKRIDATLPLLGRLMERRHRIVHNVDRSDSAPHRATRMKMGSVVDWRGAVAEFTSAVLDEV